MALVLILDYASISIPTLYVVRAWASQLFNLFSNANDEISVFVDTVTFPYTSVNKSLASFPTLSCLSISILS